VPTPRSAWRRRWTPALSPSCTTKPEGGRRVGSRAGRGPYGSR
jgi:hypothetical protein